MNLDKPSGAFFPFCLPMASVGGELGETLCSSFTDVCQIQFMLGNNQSRRGTPINIQFFYKWSYVYEDRMQSGTATHLMSRE